MLRQRQHATADRRAGARNILDEQKANMLAWLGYGAATRVSGDCDDAGGAAAEALALDGESSYGPGQLAENAAKMPIARRSATDAAHDAGTRDAVGGLVDVAEMIGFNAGNIELVR
jgi:hypothetical protein